MQPSKVKHESKFNSNKIDSSIEDPPELDEILILDNVPETTMPTTGNATSVLPSQSKGHQISHHQKGSLYTQFSFIQVPIES